MISKYRNAQLSEIRKTRLLDKIDLKFLAAYFLTELQNLLNGKKEEPNHNIK